VVLRKQELTLPMQWESVLEKAKQFDAPLRANHPDLVEEMEGVAEGAGVEYTVILALNTRSECVLVPLHSWSNSLTSFPQNLACRRERTSGRLHFPQPHFVGRYCLHRAELGLEDQDRGRDHHPRRQARRTPCVSSAGALSPESSMMLTLSSNRFKMTTEAGIIGKMGHNVEGVCLVMNAIKANSLDRNLLPIHLLMRRILQQTSAAAVRKYVDGLDGSAASV
jgi:isopenicillin-N N-acyltransferase like protein